MGNLRVKTRKTTEQPGMEVNCCRSRALLLPYSCGCQGMGQVEAISVTGLLHFFVSMTPGHYQQTELIYTSKTAVSLSKV